MPEEQEKPALLSSSRHPAFPPEQEGLFREVIELMQSNHVPFAVSGAFALQRHSGVWRDTKDLDLFLPAPEVGRALGLLSGDGFSIEVPDAVWLAKARRGDYFVDLITGMSNGVVRVDPTWIARAQPSQIVGVPARVLAPEELIASKIFVTRRERFDGADICHIIYGTRGRFEWARLLDLVGEHWQMLYWYLVLYHYVYPADSGYVPREIWEEMQERFKVELEHPNKALGFRGSLIDENMFNIDVVEWGKRNILEEHRRTAELIGFVPDNHPNTRKPRVPGAPDKAA